MTQKPGFDLCNGTPNHKEHVYVEQLKQADLELDLVYFIDLDAVTYKVKRYAVLKDNLGTVAPH